MHPSGKSAAHGFCEAVTFGFLPDICHPPLEMLLAAEGNVVPKQPPDRQLPMASAMRWVTEISAGGFLLALPALGGWWLDSQLRSAPWCLIVGGLLGLIASFLHILKITGALKTDSKRGPR